jgi:hypothetical protein
LSAGCKKQHPKKRVSVESTILQPTGNLGEGDAAAAIPDGWYLRKITS